MPNATSCGLVLALFLSMPSAMAATWQNPINRLDVNDSGVVSPQDALALVNRHLTVGPALLETPSVQPPPPYLDVNGDDYFSSIDSLLIINHLRSEGGTSATAADTAQLRLVVTDSDGNPITTASPGDTFNLRLYANDNRAVPTEVYSANADITFDSTLAQAVSQDWSSDQWNSVPIDLGTPGLLEAAGGVSFNVSPAGGGWQLIDRFELLAAAPGVVSFSLSFEDSPLYDLLLWGVNDPVPLEQIELLGTSLEIVPEPSTNLLVVMATLALVCIRRLKKSLALKVYR